MNTTVQLKYFLEFFHNDRTIFSFALIILFKACHCYRRLLTFIIFHIGEMQKNYCALQNKQIFILVRGTIKCL